MSFEKELKAMLQTRCGVKDCPEHVIEPAEAIKALIKKHQPEPVGGSATRDLEAIAHYKGYNSALADSDRAYGLEDNL